MPISKTILKVLLFFCVIAFINLCISFIWTPAESTSAFTMKEYRNAIDIDTLFIGSSLCQRSFNPYIIDQTADLNTFNMGTLAQSLSHTLLGVKTAIRNHPIKTVVIGLNYGTLMQKDSIYSDVTFTHSFYSDLSFPEKAYGFLEFILEKEHFFSEHSINFFFPWVYNNVGFSPSVMIENISAKIANALHPAQNGNKGFRYIDTQLNQTIDYTTKNRTSSEVYSGEYQQDAFNTLEQIIAICHQNDVDLMIVNTPCPAFDILIDHANYFQSYSMLQSFFSSHNTPYYDFSLAKPELFKNEAHYYYDFEHMNKAGCEAFSKSFGRFLVMRKNSADVSSLFYTPEEYLESVDYIALVDFDAMTSADHLDIQARALIGTDTTIEYEFLLIDSSASTQCVLQSYSTSSTLSIPLPASGEYMLRVNARQAGNTSAYEQYCVQPLHVL